MSPPRSRSHDDILEFTLAPPAAGALESSAPLRQLFCITMFNEPATQLIATLDALLAALRVAREARQRCAGDAAVCLVIDGRSQVQPEVLDWLLTAGCVDAEALQHDGRTRLFDACALEVGGERFRTFVIVKGHNRGKLHSHALFFGLVCARVEPRLCFQLDTGTLVAPEAVSAMLARFAAKPRTAALASHIHSACDAPGLLGGWQFMDFASQAAVSWPAEQFSGHLSVLPGQFCGFRWRAISPQRRQALCNEAALELACRQPAADPLGRYLHGLQAQSFGQRLMFLAEDRVMGSEIVLQPGGWRLGFCTEAHAQTDACTTLPELLRQRRRWNNGATACRLWLLSQWAQRLGHTGRNGHLAWAMLWQVLLLAQQLLAPALLVLGGALCLQAMSALWQQGQWGWPLAWVGGMALGGVAGWGQRVQGGSGRGAALVRDLGFTLAGVCQVAMLVHALPVAATLLLLLPPATATLLTARAMGPQGGTVLRRACEYLLWVNPVMQVVLWAYALARVGDLSWGTKGLVGSAGHGLRRLRVGLAGAASLSLWLAGNAALVAWAWQAPTDWSGGLDPVLGAVSLLLGLTLVFTLLHSLFPWLRHRRAHLPTDLEGEVA
nr:glycosyltransferase family 2 protein [uncultured Rhodoferax sp.]